LWAMSAREMREYDKEMALIAVLITLWRRRIIRV
jgi:hypothetical protein